MLKCSYSERVSIDYPDVDFKVEKDVVGYPRVKQDVVDGKIVNTLEFVIDDDRKNYRVDDFALENLLAAGVQLHDMKFADPSLSSVERDLNSIVESSKN